MHPLFLIPLASVATWAACHWWYGRQVRALKRSLSNDTSEDARQDDQVWTVLPPPLSGAGDALALRLTSLGGRPVLPFLDTSPLSHLAEPDLFATIADLETPGAADRPYLN